MPLCALQAAPATLLSIDYAIMRLPSIWTAQSQKPGPSNQTGEHADGPLLSVLYFDREWSQDVQTKQMYALCDVIVHTVTGVFALGNPKCRRCTS